MAIHEYWEHENPPYIAANYEIAAYDGGGELLEQALGRKDQGAIVYYLMVKNLGNASARGLEMRIKNVVDDK